MSDAAPIRRDWPLVRSMCAVGQQGQLGLHGGLPWEGQRGEVFDADVERFWNATRGAVLLVGPKTRASIPPSMEEDRTIVEIRSHMEPADVLARFQDRVVYVGGGVAVWNAYAPFIQHWDVTRLPYDGPADRVFDPAWLFAG